MAADRLNTARLDLIPWTPELLVRLIEQPERFAELAGYPPDNGLRDFFVSGEASSEWLARLRSSSGPDPWRYGFYLVDRDSRMVIGTAAFKGPPDGGGTVEIAYGVVPSHEGRGFATEAAGALVKFASTDERVRLVIAHTLPRANASTRVLTKCGFQFAGEVVDPEDGPVWRWERGLLIEG
jgi:ribosomal-protein-alanine N-acetyltransferase